MLSILVAFAAGGEAFAGAARRTERRVPQYGLAPASTRVSTRGLVKVEKRNKTKKKQPLPPKKIEIKVVPRASEGKAFSQWVEPWRTPGAAPAER